VIGLRPLRSEVRSARRVSASDSAQSDTESLGFRYPGY
jgi:hypothetical protein